MPWITYFTQDIQDCLEHLHAEHTYRHKYDVLLAGEHLGIPSQVAEIMHKRFPVDLYDACTKKPWQRPNHFFVEVCTNGPSLRFYDLTAAIMNKKVVSECNELGRLVLGLDNIVRLPLEFIIQAKLREKPRDEPLILAPFQGYDTFGLWTKKAYEKCTKSNPQ